MKLLGISSPVRNSAVSLDLLNLYVVNQISCQKKTPETVRKPVHVNMKRDIKMPLRKHNLELPMSPPRVPSKLCIDDIENNIHYQRLGNKEEPGPVRLSNINYSNSLVSKLNESHDALSPSYKTAEFRTLLGRLNSPGNINFLTGRPAVFMSEDFASMDKGRHSDFITEKQSVQHIWGENRKKVSNFLEDMNQPPPSLLPGNFDSFLNANVINLLSIDQERIKKSFDKCGYESVGDIYAVTSSVINYSSDRCIRSIFTDPELNFSSSNFNKTSYPEKCQPNNNYQREYNKEGNNPSTFFEKDCYPASSEEKGKFERDCLEKTSQIEIQKYPVSNIINNSLEELHSKKSWDAGLGENLMEEGGTCPVQGAPTTMQKICQHNDLDSSQCSQSSSYSPRPTDSYFSSSSEMPSEDEDQSLQQIEDSSQRATKNEETTNNSLEGMAEFSHDRIIDNNAKIHKQNENFHQFSIKNNTDQFAESQSNSAHVLQNKASDNCTLQFVSCDAWVQTESEPVRSEKLDAAIQCDRILECKCRRDVLPLCNVDKCGENIKADTTGGQEILKNN
ncbi:regulator of DNA class I crossover intermediates 1 [Saccopteryx bilineata]|uniref:regulator of DNA class I crossover intermediates 1 n=1 Tax=Saccopteryx bilineata TaxID=59482 RepID=UPI00338E310F